MTLTGGSVAIRKKKTTRRNKGNGSSPLNSDQIAGIEVTTKVVSRQGRDGRRMRIRTMTNAGAEEKW